MTLTVSCVMLADIEGKDMEEKTTLVTGLQAYSRYQFRVIAVNEIGNSVPSDPSRESSDRHDFLSLKRLTFTMLRHYQV